MCSILIEIDDLLELLTLEKSVPSIHDANQRNYVNCALKNGLPLLAHRMRCACFLSYFIGLMYWHITPKSHKDSQEDYVSESYSFDDICVHVNVLGSRIASSFLCCL